LRVYFYAIEAETKGLDAELNKAEKSFGRLSDFIKANPVAAAGAMGAALIAVGVRATEMAGEVDAAMRKVAIAVPGATDRLNELKDTGRELATEFGISQTEIAKVMEMVARTGVESTDELIAASRAAVRAQRATGEEFATIVGLIDTAMDNFGVSAQDADAQLAKLIATAKGKISLAELEEVLKAIGPTAKKAGVDFTTMVEAIVSVRPTAKNAKDAIAELNNAAEQPGGLQALAERSHVATDGIKEMGEQIRTANATIENQSAILREKLNAELIRFGDVILPIVIKALTALTDLLGDATTKMHRFQEEIRNTAGTEEQAEAVKGLGGAMRELVGDVQVLSRATLGHAIKDDFDAINAALSDANRLAKVTPTHLKDLEEGLAAAAGSGKLTTVQMKAVAEALSKINAEQLKRQPFITPKDTDGLKDVAERLEKIKSLAASGAGLEEIQKALGFLSRAETEAATKAIANHKKAETAATSRAKAETAAAKVIIASVETIGAKMSETSAKLKQAGDQIRDNFRASAEGQKAVLDGTDEIARLQAVVNAKLAEYRKFQDDAAHKEEERVAKALRLVSAIGGAAQGLLGAAQAAGILDDHIVATLGHVINIAEQIAAIDLSGKDLFDPANLTSLIGIVGSLAGAISSLFGESPAAKAHAELIKHNNEVLAELVAVNGDLLRINVPGGKLGDIEQVLTTALGANTAAGGGFRGGEAFDRTLRENLVKLGLSFKDLEEVADTLGIQLRNPKTGHFEIEGFQAFLKALSGIDVGFADDFQGSLDRIRAYLESGILDATQEFAAILAETTKRSPAIAKALEGINPFTAEGRAASIDALQQLLLDFAGGNLDKGALGGLTGTQFVDAITQLIQFLSSDANLKPLTGTELPGGTGDQPPLEFTPDAETSSYYSESLGAASDQTDLLAESRDLADASLSIEERQANTLDAILAALLAPQTPGTGVTIPGIGGGTVEQQALDGLLASLATFQPVAPPALPDSVFGPTANGPITVTLAVTAPVTITAPPGTDAAQQGALAGQALYTEVMDRFLGDRYRVERLLRGEVI